LRPSSTRGDSMMTTSSRVALAAFASLFLVTSAFAQTPATPAPAAKAAPAEKKAEKPRTPESIACSAEADAKNLHGKKDRGPFMRQCKKDAKAAAAAKK
jgi:hypothetical protein